MVRIVKTDVVTKDYSRCPMGKAVASAIGPDFVDDFDWKYVSVDGLSVKEAWAMATKWAPLLQDHASIRVHHHRHQYFGYFEIAPDYEWIELWLGCCAQSAEKAVAARAASLVWRALAACRGYRKQENPLFWKRLFSELHKEYSKAKDKSCEKATSFKSRPVTDENGLFCKVLFPRFMLHLSSKHGADVADRMARLFCGLECDDSQRSSVTLREMDEILDRLEQFAQPNEPSVVSPVELALRVTMTQADEPRMNDLIAAIQAPRPLNSHNIIKNKLMTALLCQPYVVNVVAFGDNWRRFPNATQARWDLECGRQLQTPIASRRISGTYSTEFQPFVMWALGIHRDPQNNKDNNNHGGIGYLQLMHADNDDSIASVCSALPYTQVLHTFHIDSYDTYHNPITDWDLAWIGYALFHPDAASSTWRRLAFGGIYYARNSSKSSNETIEMMAKGNNLAVALGTTSTVVSGYYTATIRAGAVVRRDPQEDAEVVKVLQVSTKMDVCVATTVTAKLTEWVVVVVVGYGMGYVRAGFIDEIVSRPPGKPFLSALKFVDLNELFKLIELAGSALEYLDLRGYKTHTSQMLETISTCCPRLQSLTIPVPLRENIPSDWIFPASLRELQLNFKYEHSTVVLTETSLARLQELVLLRISARRPLTASDNEQFVRPLLHSLRRLQKFVWVSASDRELDEMHLTYPMKRHITRSMLEGGLEEAAGIDGVAMTSDQAPTQSIVALLSVTEQYRSYHGLPLLDRELIMLVSGFTGTTTRRDLWVDGARVGTTLINGVVPPPDPPSEQQDVFFFGGEDY